MAEKEQSARLAREREMTAAVERDATAAREAQKRADRNSVFFFLICLAAGCGILYFGFSEWLAGTLMGAPVLTAIAAILRARVR
jgi:fatty acid desaturase